MTPGFDSLSSESPAASKRFAMLCPRGGRDGPPAALDPLEAQEWLSFLAVAQQADISQAERGVCD